MTPREWLVSGLWLVGVIAGLAWVLPKLRLEDEWDEAIDMDEEWVDAGHPVGLPPVRQKSTEPGPYDHLWHSELPKRKQPVDESSAWQDRARKAEALGFRDEDDAA